MSADLSGYTIWVLGNSHADQSQFAVQLTETVGVTLAAQTVLAASLLA